ncbi:hypothetical protein [Herbiconiux liangxiaofengii]|uniref:hypothetical protein n=1 Tax=Herbiconiux liangxiaofengii TaxID=3342795 RepID=UPI0035BAF6E1
MAGLGWKATVAIGVVFLVVAVVTSPLFFGGADTQPWRWLLTVGWFVLGVAQLVRARRKYVAEKRDGAKSVEP